jgi:hypothetical protein
MKIIIKKEGESYTVIDGRTDKVIIASKDYDELANAIYKNAVPSYSSGDLNKFKKSYFRKIINLVDKKQSTSFYLGENINMKKSELKQFIKEEIQNLKESKRPSDFEGATIKHIVYIIGQKEWTIITDKGDFNINKNLEFKTAS